MASHSIPLPPRAESAEDVIRLLDLKPHIEGGFYRETWRDPTADASRGRGTAVYFLLPGNVVNRWHRIDATEHWHFYAGSPLELSIAPPDRPLGKFILGGSIFDGERPQIEVPPNSWQRARSLGPWTLIGCTVCPAFEFSRFELAEHGFDPAINARER